MRRIAFVIACMLLLSMFGCAAKPERERTDTPATASTVSPADNGTTDEEFLENLAKTEGKITTFQAYEQYYMGQRRLQENDDGTFWMLDDGALYMLGSTLKPVTDVQTDTALLTGVRNYWLCDYMVVCWCEGDVLAIVNNGGVKIRTMSLPPSFCERALTVLDYQDGYLLCAEQGQADGKETRLVLYNVANESFTDVDGFANGTAALLEGMVYYSVSDAQESEFELKMYNIAAQQTQLLCRATDTPAAWAEYSDRTILWVVSDRAQPPAYMSWCVDDDIPTWTAWDRSLLEEYAVVQQSGATLLSLRNHGRTDGFYPLYCGDPVTGETVFLALVPDLPIYVSKDMNYAYCVEGSQGGTYIYKLPLPTA